MGICAETPRTHRGLRHEYMRTNRIHGTGPGHQTYCMVTSDESRQLSVIIVEDDEDIADSIRYNLEREGYRLRLATSGESALGLILERLPNLIILDLNLPQMNGFE